MPLTSLMYVNEAKNKKLCLLLTAEIRTQPLIYKGKNHGKILTYE